MRYSLFQTFAVPLLLLALTIGSLILGLAAKGWPDTVAVALLAVPILVILSAWLGRPVRPAKLPPSA
ncbi:hypothetical protein ACMGDH_04720 [Sphingomonas sp. DT-207]|uniref:hypothetical protein n=1 Tax=Sphingomonas sp. DT-207 TaxID=3396167 RepID=UPI003F1CB837